MKNGTQVLVTRLPDCDFCLYYRKQVPASYDALTRDGRWALMCESCYYSFAKTTELGTGKGQRLILAQLA